MTGRIIPRKPRLCVFSYGALTRLVHAAVPEFNHRADIQVLEVVLDEALRVGRELDQSRAHDVIISAGANASLLQSALIWVPVVSEGKVSGYDLLQGFAERRARPPIAWAWASAKSCCPSLKPPRSCYRFMFHSSLMKQSMTSWIVS
ncbi:PrpR N-terminal domain-containing protein [Candidatus Aalborgicola defluviihabitans]|uniref:PrpR N-terminal domain-containing protein n=1 Tax=Candidatus Aalborgicola defluviihabitans TaxID=3386187 RepID=UPI0039B95ACE